MKYRIITLYLLIILYSILVSCARNKSNPVGAAIFQRDNMGSEYYRILQPSAADTFYQTYVANVNSSRLFLGESGTEQVRTAMRFALLPREGTVDSAFIQIKPVRAYGPGGVFTANVHEVLIPWNDTTGTWEHFDDGSIGRELAAVEFSSADNDDSLSIRFPLPADFVQSWIDSATAENNYGIIFTTENAPFITEFYSGISDNFPDNRPSLIMYITSDTTHTELTYDDPQDAFLATTTQPPSTELLYIADGSALRTYGKVDLDSIPDEATINRAQLIMYSDTTLSFPDHRDEFRVLVFAVTSDEWSVPSVPFDSSFSISAAISSDSIVINMTPYVQGWNFGLKENHGYVLVGYLENQSINKRVFYSMNAIIDKRPKMEIYYSLPPSSRF